MTSSDEYLKDCPFCADPGTKPKLSVNYKKGVFKCWKCEKAGKIDQLLTLGVISKEDHWSYISSNDDVSLLAPLRSTKNNLLGYEYRTLTSNDTEALNYLETRYDNLSDILDVFFIPVGKKFQETWGDIWKDYLLIKFSDTYFQLRAFRGNHLRKYLMPPKEIASPELFLHTNDDLRYCFIVEGVFDAICAGNAIATLGKNLPDGRYAQLVEYISENPHHEYVLALDPDAFSCNFKHVKKLLDDGILPTVGIVDIHDLDFEKGDLGSFKTNMYEKLIDHVENYNKLALLMMKLRV